MRTIFTIIALFFLSDLIAQEDSLLIQREKQLIVLLDDLRLITNTNQEKEAKNKLFKTYLFETIQLKNAINYPFSGLKTVGTIFSEDRKIRLFNWNIEQDDHTQKYYCYILRLDERKNEYLVSELVDNSFMIPLRPDGILNGTDWYGALYYKIIPISKGNKEMYTLLGLDMNTTMSNIKLIDVLYFTGNNPKLGSPIFKTKTETLKRVFYEHSEKAYMSLKYEANYSRIIFDHLEPETQSMTGFYSYYVPDFTYDAFIYVKDKWVLELDVVGVNPKSKGTITIYTQNEQTGEVESKEVKEKWINPSDPSAIAGGGNHVVRTPDSPLSPKEKSNKKIRTKKEKALKKDEYSMNPYLENNKKKRWRK